MNRSTLSKASIAAPTGRETAPKLASYKVLGIPTISVVISRYVSSLTRERIFSTCFPSKPTTFPSSPGSMSIYLAVVVRFSGLYSENIAATAPAISLIRLVMNNSRLSCDDNIDNSIENRLSFDKASFCCASASSAASLLDSACLRSVMSIATPTMPTTLPSASQTGPI